MEIFGDEQFVIQLQNRLSRSLSNDFIGIPKLEAMHENKELL